MEAGRANKQIAEFENRVAMLSQEIERLNSVVEGKNNEIRTLKENFDHEINLAQ